jgi:hypothetical protein
MSVCEKTTTLIFLVIKLVHHYIYCTGTGSSTTVYCTCSRLVLLIWSWRKIMTYNQSASLAWCLTPIWSPWPDFCFLFDNCGFLAVGRPLWWEAGPLIYSYNCFWALPEQSLLGPSPTELRLCGALWSSSEADIQNPDMSPYNKYNWYVYLTCRRLSMRPTQEELEERNILKSM